MSDMPQDDAAQFSPAIAPAATEATAAESVASEAVSPPQPVAPPEHHFLGVLDDLFAMLLHLDAMQPGPSPSGLIDRLRARMAALRGYFSPPPPPPPPEPGNG